MVPVLFFGRLLIPLMFELPRGSCSGSLKLSASTVSVDTITTHNRMSELYTSTPRLLHLHGLRYPRVSILFSPPSAHAIMLELHGGTCFGSRLVSPFAMSVTTIRIHPWTSHTMTSTPELLHFHGLRNPRYSSSFWVRNPMLLCSNYIFEHAVAVHNNTHVP